MDSSQNPRAFHIIDAFTYICDGPPLLPASGVLVAFGVCPGGTLPEFGGAGVVPGAGVVEPDVGEFAVVGLVGFVPGFGVVEVLGGIVPGAWTHPFTVGAGTG